MSRGRAARRKGLTFERDIAVALREVFPGAKRHLEFQTQEANGVDLDNTGDFRIQCKKLAKYAPISKIEEVQCDRLFGEIPVLITAGDNEEAMVVLPFSDFLNLLKEKGIK